VFVDEAVAESELVPEIVPPETAVNCPPVIAAVAVTDVVGAARNTLIVPVDNSTAV